MPRIRVIDILLALVGYASGDAAKQRIAARRVRNPEREAAWTAVKFIGGGALAYWLLAKGGAHMLFTAFDSMFN